MKKKHAALPNPKPPIEPRPRFKPGQRVRISPTGIHWLIAKAGTTGTVVACGFGVDVLIDGERKPRFYAPEDWEAEP
jgi:hypothetical protein